MESIWRRLKYYGIGFTLGLIFVIFFFQNRGCSWLPENRVKNTILDRVLVVSDSEQKQFNKLNLDLKDAYEALNDGELNFSKSKKNEFPKVFVIEKTIKKSKKYFYYILPDESFISEVMVSSKLLKSLPKITKNGNGKLIHFPKDKNLVYLDDTKLMSCQLANYKNINNASILTELKKNGEINFGKSNFKAKPKVEHFLIFHMNDIEFCAETIWFKNKLNITRFDSLVGTNCD